MLQDRRILGGHTGSAVLAADTVAVAVESVDVGSDHLDGPLNVGGAVAAAACTVDVASDRDTGAAVVRVALLGFPCSYRDDPGDGCSDNYLPDQFFVYLNSVIVGEFGFSQLDEVLAAILSA